MRRIFYGVFVILGAVRAPPPRAAGAPLAPLGRSWAVPTLGLLSEWWTKTVACSGHSGKMTEVSFYRRGRAVRSHRACGELAHAWWVRKEIGCISPPAPWVRMAGPARDAPRIASNAGPIRPSCSWDACHVASARSGGTRR